MDDRYLVYDFYLDSPFIPLKGDCNCECNSVDIDSIKNAIDESLDDKLKHINCHINCATSTIINEIKESNQEICLCNMATKKDIINAVNEINTHVDEKFNEIDFIKQFDNLNNQLENIKNNGK